MKRSHRRWHLLIWLTLTVVLAVGLSLALRYRPTQPPGSDQPPLHRLTENAP